MRFFLIAGLIASLSASVLSACGGTQSSADQESTHAVPGVNATIAFTSAGPLLLAPGQLVALAVTTSPPARYEVSFRLLGDSLDASLSATSLVADSNGIARFELLAPNHAGTFAVRATIKDGSSADLLVSMSDQGFSTLHVMPQYEGGRPVASWVAHAAAGVTCEQLADTLPNDPEGALTSTAPAEEALFLTDAPVGPNLAVMARAGRYAWGCTDVADLTPGTVRSVSVHVANKPIDTTVNALDVALAFVPAPTEWEFMLAQERVAMTHEFTALGSEPQTLLATMLSLAPAPAAFATAATNNGWLAALDAHYALAPTSPTDALIAWAQTAAKKPPQIRGTLSSLDESHGLFVLESIGALAGDKTGAPQDYVMTVGVAPNDELHLGGALFMLPSRYIGATVAEAALASSMNAETVKDALAKLVGCGDLGLVGAPSCNAECVESLCEGALETLWQRARDASATGNTSAVIPLKASGQALFDNDAVLTGFDGSWLGHVQCASVVAKVSGKATATLSSMPPPK